MATVKANDDSRLEGIPSRLLSQVASIAGRIVTARMAALGAHRYQYSVLAVLEARGPSSQALLSRRTWIDTSDMVATLNELAAEGYVARTVDPTDRRRNLVSITDAGRNRLAGLTTVVDEAQEEFLAPLSEEERATLVATLTRLLDHHGHP